MSLAVHLASLDENAVAQVRRRSERSQFEQTYWAKLIGIESSGVEAAMVSLRRHLEQWSSTGSKPADLPPAILELSRECKAHLEQVENEIAELSRRIVELTVTSK